MECFLGVSLDRRHGKSMQELKNYVDSMRGLPLKQGSIDVILSGTVTGVVKA
jgi:hypothetical protein